MMKEIICSIRLVAFDFDGVFTDDMVYVLQARAAKLKIRCIQDVGDKRAVLEGFARELGIAMSEVAFVGNDINDLPVLRCVGLPIVVKNAHPDVIEHSIYQTRCSGGHGAVREVCDLVEKTLTPASVEVHALL
jgi:YrbI family 3-deoxy-D-manno-octulosonate 8-phosphate phosphatase